MLPTVVESFFVSPGFIQSFTEEGTTKIPGEFPPKLQHYLISWKHGIHGSVLMPLKYPSVCDIKENAQL